MLNASVSASCAYRRGAASGPVVLDGMAGIAPGLGGGKTDIAERVAYMVGERVRHKCLSVPHPRFVLTNSVFKLRSS